MNKRTAAYQIVYYEIKKRIYSESYPIGSLLPTEAELVAEFDVSRTTIRHAIDLLSQEGFVRATAGKGTMVIDYKTSQSLNGITSITETLRRKGMDVCSKSLYIDKINANEKVAGELGVDINHEVVRVQRVQMANGIPIAIMKNYVPAELVPDIEHVMTKEQSLYMCLESNYNLVIEKTYDKISARAATFTDAEILSVPMGEPLIAFARICIHAGKPVCVDHVSIVGRYYEFELSLNGKPGYSE